MRPIVALLLWLGSGALSSLAQQFRVATWQLDSLPLTKAGITNSPADLQRFNEVATTLSSTDADVIILYGIAESEAARIISGLMKPRKYSVAHHTAFRHGGSKGPIVAPAVAILSRREKMAAKNIAWGDTGRIEMPGGFGFGVFRHGSSAVCVYVAGLPGSLTNGVGSSDGKYFARKRNYAAQFLAHHSSWLAGTYTNPVVATYLTGDFQVAPKGPLSDECAKTLEAAGFRALAPGTAADKSTLSVTNALDLDRVQDPIFTRGVEFIASRQINSPPPGRPLIVCDITLKAPGTTAKVLSKPQTTRPPAARPVPEPAQLPEPVPVPAPANVDAVSPRLVSDSSSISTNAVASAPAPVTSVPAAEAAPAASSASAVLARPTFPPLIPNQPRWLWWLAVGFFGLGVFLSTRRWRARRRSAVPIRRRANEAVYVELQPEAASQPGQERVPGDAAIVGGSSTATGHADEAPRKEMTAGGADALRARMIPQFRQLMRERVVGWLARQRQELLESHERGTEQVASLQARLEAIKGQFQTRLLAQQQRIVELDAALRTKERIILELLRGRPPG